MAGFRKKGKSQDLNNENEASAKQGVPQSTTKTQEARRSAEKLFRGEGGTENKSEPIREAAEMVKLPLGHIRLDPTNVRTRYINVHKPTENVLEPDHPDYQSNQELIDGLSEFSEKLKTNPILQPPAVYKEKGQYYTAYGARRFLSLLIAYGPNVGATFKVYNNKPSKIASMRFVENAQREDLPLNGKLLEFENAYVEVSELLKEANQKPTVEAIANELQKSPSMVSVYRYALETAQLYNMIAEGVVTTFGQLRAARKAKAKTRDEILAAIKGQGVDEKKTPRTKPRNSGGRPMKNVAWPKVKDVTVMRRVINGELAKFDWEEEDFESLEALSRKLKECMDKLKSEQQ